MKTSIITTGHFLPTSGETRVAAAICEKHNATLVVNRDRRGRIDTTVSTNAWWICAENLGPAYTRAVMAAITADLEAAGITLS